MKEKLKISDQSIGDQFNKPIILNDDENFNNKETKLKWIHSFQEAETGDKQDILIEYSIVLNTNKHGLESFGWADENKIIIFDLEIKKKEKQKYRNFVKKLTKLMNQNKLFLK